MQVQGVDFNTKVNAFNEDRELKEPIKEYSEWPHYSSLAAVKLY